MLTATEKENKKAIKHNRKIETKHQLLMVTPRRHPLYIYGTVTRDLWTATVYSWRCHCAGLDAELAPSAVGPGCNK